jgi:hypothetical protein
MPAKRIGYLFEGAPQQEGACIARLHRPVSRKGEAARIEGTLTQAQKYGERGAPPSNLRVPWYEPRLAKIGVDRRSAHVLTCLSWDFPPPLPTSESIMSERRCLLYLCPGDGIWDHPDKLDSRTATVRIWQGSLPTCLTRRGCRRTRSISARPTYGKLDMSAYQCLASHIVPVTS